MDNSDDSIFLPTREGYDRWSKIYDNDDIPLAVLEEPVVDSILDPIAGLQILDLGCGTGRQSVRLAGKGAIVTGLDQSQGMLEKAREKKAPRLTLVEHDLNAPLPFADHSFDRVVSFLVLEHIDDLKAFFAECRRVCRPEGFLFFSVMHPALLLRGVQARFSEEGSQAKVYPKSYPYQISDYVTGAIAGGLRLTWMGEYACDESHTALTEKAIRYLNWPMLLALKFFPN